MSRGLADRLHQPHRAHLYPRSADLLGRARGLGALGATISGAGPTVLVWSHYEQTGAVMDALSRETRQRDASTEPAPTSEASTSTDVETTGRERADDTRAIYENLPATRGRLEALTPRRRDRRAALARARTSPM